MLIFSPIPDRSRINRRISRDDGDMNSSSYMNPFSSSHTRLQRRNGDPSGYDLDMDVGLDYPMENDSSDSSQDRVPLEIGDSDKLLVFYETAFRALQQLNCRQIAKAFIKVIEPRKQVKHPYNGGKAPPGSAPGEKGDPEKTKPDWWPTGVTHKEPDHLKKPGTKTFIKLRRLAIHYEVGYLLTINRTCPPTNSPVP